MRKVVDGVLYDTEAEGVEEIVSFSNNLPYSDFEHVKESLYRTAKGRFFLAGGGGPMSKYATSVPGGGTSGSKDITPMSEEDAFQWLERHQFVSELQELFPEKLECA